MAKVCFMLTVYNKEAWIAQTLQTIMTQNLQDIEIVVWDDGSTDASMDIVRHYAKEDKRFIIGGTKKNYGISVAYNKARHLVTAPYVCISSADDLYDKFRAQRTYDYFTKHPEKRVVYGGFTKVFASGKIIEHKKAVPYNKEALFRLNNQYIPHGFMSVCKEVLDIDYDESIKYGIDYPWIKEIAKKYEPFRFGTTKADFGIYRATRSNVSHQHVKEITGQELKEHFGKQT